MEGADSWLRCFTEPFPTAPRDPHSIGSPELHGHTHISGSLAIYILA